MRNKSRVFFTRLLVAGAALVACGTSLLAVGCDSKSSDKASTEEERKSFAGDPSKMPPEARAKMEAAMKAGAGKTKPQGATP